MAEGVSTPGAAKRRKLALPPLSPSSSTAALKAFMAGVKVFLPQKGIPFVSTRSKIWSAGVERAGGLLTQDPKAAGVTHVVVGEGGLASLPPQLQPGGARPATSSADRSTSASASTQQQQRRYVNEHWLARCLAKQQLLPTEDYPSPDPEAEVPTPTAGGSRPPSRSSDSSMGSGAASRSSSVGRPGASQRLSAQDQRLKRWLGDELWHPACAGMGLTELALQAVYSQERSQRIGNEPVVQALRELARYERALHEDYFEEEGGKNTQLGKTVNHRSLRYAKAAAIVRASAVRVTPDIRGGDLPFIGDVTAQQISDIIRTGSCAALDCFRADVAVTDSRGRRRGDTVGAATRAAFHALPTVGQKTAKQWWDLGCRSLEHVEFAAEPGGPLGEGGAFPITPEQRFSLERRGDLLEAASGADIQEMLGAVRRGLEAVSGTGGWLIEVVGGGARSSARHDADFLVTHPTAPIEGVVLQLRDHLVDSGCLFPPGQAMCRVQAGLLPNHIDWLREEHLKEASAAPSVQTLDRFDHIYGIARPGSGKARRMDIIICPHDEWSFALVGWIGSRTFLRFMRQHAKDCGMYLTSHRLLRKVEGRSLLVPDEAAPTDRSGSERWPPGWHPGRRVQSQRDVFELLGLPYRHPQERDA